MNAKDMFTGTLASRTCPGGVPLPVWTAFARWADCRDKVEVAATLWQAYLAIHAEHYPTMSAKGV